MNLDALLDPTVTDDGDLVYGKPLACPHCHQERAPELVGRTERGRQIFWYRIPDACCPTRAREQIQVYGRELARYQGAENARQKDFDESLEQRLADARTEDQKARLRGRQYRPASGVEDEIRDLQGRVRALKALSLQQVRGDR